MRFLSIVLVTLILLGACGCGTIIGMLNHLAGNPEAAPPLGESLSVGRFVDDAHESNSSYGSYFGNDELHTVVSPAVDATIADLAGTWIQAEGIAAVHIDNSGRVFQVDLAQDFRQYLEMDNLPLTIYNVGTATISPDGVMQANLTVSIFPISASGTASGTLDSTHNVLYGMSVEATITDGSSSYSDYDYSSWLRWDPQTGVLAIDN